ncbi:hypothetical protein B0H17DRAFT_1130496 [Mycena rosella]|uniref:Uncharacterized protein n=1 Tax=Mycena rosella TaxID=1033263 RepID=A0AAD7DQA4_MYCRO|nr:hypothetical protein B0H17DRAFT_1130496 [Mycena rosella]
MILPTPPYAGRLRVFVRICRMRGVWAPRRAVALRSGPSGERKAPRNGPPRRAARGVRGGPPRAPHPAEMTSASKKASYQQKGPAPAEKAALAKGWSLGEPSPSEKTPGLEPRPLRRRRRQPAALSPLANTQAAAPRFPPPPPALQPLPGEHDPALEYYRVAISNGLALLNNISQRADAATRELGVFHAAIRERGSGMAGARPGGVLPEGATTRVLHVGARNADQTDVDTTAILVFGETAQDHQPTLADSIAKLRGMIPGLSSESDHAQLPAPVQPGASVVLPAIATRPLRANALDLAQPEALADAQPRASDVRDP